MSPYRSEFHSGFRTGLTETIIIPALKDEIKVNIGAETAGDLIRGVRTSPYALDSEQGEVLFSSVIMPVNPYLSRARSL